MTRGWLVLGLCVASVAFLGTLPGAAGAKSHLRYIGEIRKVVGDGRYVAWDRDLRTTHVIDTRSGDSFDVPDPSGCEQRVGSYGPYGGGLVDVGGGYLMWECRDPHHGGDVPGLMRVGGDRLVLAAGSDELRQQSSGDGGIGFTAVGRHWIRWYANSYHSTRQVFLNWRTGQRRTYDDEEQTAANLDEAGLVEHFCQPLKRRPNPQFEDDYLYTSEFKPFDYERPYGLTVAGGRSRALLLERCGRQHHTVVSRCAGGDCDSPDLFAGVVTWVEGRDVYAYSIRTGRRHHLGRLDVYPASSVDLFHTRTRLYIHVPAPSNRTYVARLPRS